jgi:hypothetical protein
MHKVMDLSQFSLIHYRRRLINSTSAQFTTVPNLAASPLTRHLVALEVEVVLFSNEDCRRNKQQLNIFRLFFRKSQHS